MDKALHSSERHDWRTPESVLHFVRKLAPISWDPCPSNDPAHWFAEENWPENGLICKWGPGLVYVNPPYGRELPKWVNKADEEWSAQPHALMEIVLLCPARPGNKWWTHAWTTAHAYCFWDGRITFEGAPGPAPFPSAVFYWGCHPYRFCDVFGGAGIVGLL